MFSGRIGRLGLLLGAVYLILPIVVVIVLYAFIGFALNTAHPAGTAAAFVNTLVFLFSAVWLLFLLVGAVGLVVRRWHDLNQSGWLALLGFVPIVGQVTGLIQLFVPGTDGPNNFGAPQAGHGFKAVLFGSGTPQVPPVPAQPPGATLLP